MENLCFSLIGSWDLCFRTLSAPKYPQLLPWPNSGETHAPCRHSLSPQHLLFCVLMTGVISWHRCGLHEPLRAGAASHPLPQLASRCPGVPALQDQVLRTQRALHQQWVQPGGEWVLRWWGTPSSPVHSLISSGNCHHWSTSHSPSEHLLPALPRSASSMRSESRTVSTSTTLSRSHHSSSPSTTRSPRLASSTVQVGHLGRGTSGGQVVIATQQLGCSSQNWRGHPAMEKLWAWLWPAHSLGRELVKYTRSYRQCTIKDVRTQGWSKI